MKNRRGEIATLLTIGAMVFVGITAVLSSLTVKDTKTTSSRASCPGGQTTCYGDMNNVNKTICCPTASTICDLDSAYKPICKSKPGISATAIPATPKPGCNVIKKTCASYNSAKYKTGDYYSVVGGMSMYVDGNCITTISSVGGLTSYCDSKNPTPIPTQTIVTITPTGATSSLPLSCQKKCDEGTPYQLVGTSPMDFCKNTLHGTYVSNSSQTLCGKAWLCCKGATVLPTGAPTLTPTKPPGGSGGPTPVPGSDGSLYPQNDGRTEGMACCFRQGDRVRVYAHATARENGTMDTPCTTAAYTNAQGTVAYGADEWFECPDDISVEITKDEYIQKVQPPAPTDAVTPPGLEAGCQYVLNKPECRDIDEIDTEHTYTHNAIQGTCCPDGVVAVPTGVPSTECEQKFANCGAGSLHYQGADKFSYYKSKTCTTNQSTELCYSINDPLNCTILPWTGVTEHYCSQTPLPPTKAPFGPIQATPIVMLPTPTDQFRAPFQLPVPAFSTNVDTILIHNPCTTPALVTTLQTGSDVIQINPGNISPITIPTTPNGLDTIVSQLSTQDVMNMIVPSANPGEQVINLGCN